MSHMILKPYYIGAKLYNKIVMFKPFMLLTNPLNVVVNTYYFPLSYIS
jgi:hypothetical protein